MSDLHERAVRRAQMDATPQPSIAGPDSPTVAVARYTLRVLEAFEPMRAALERYGVHLYECVCYHGSPESDCTCGFDAALRAAREVEQ